MASASSVKEFFLSDIKHIPSVKLDNFTLDLELKEASGSLSKIAKQELRETPDLIKESICALQKLLKEEPDLSAPLDKRSWLIKFLRPTKFYPESAHKLIQNYYSFKTKYANLYENLLPSKEPNAFNQDILTVLPLRDQEGRRVVVLDLGKKWNPSKCSLDEIFKAGVLLIEAIMLEPKTQICGVQFILDVEGFSMQQTWQFSPLFAKRILDLLQGSFPARVKGIHIINQPTSQIFNALFALFIPFMTEKLISRCFVHGTDLGSLHQRIASNCLPERYGGTGGVQKVSGNEWLQLLILLEDEFKAINSFGYKTTNREESRTMMF